MHVASTASRSQGRYKTNISAETFRFQGTASPRAGTPRTSTPHSQAPHHTVAQQHQLSESCEHLWREALRHIQTQLKAPEAVGVELLSRRSMSADLPAPLPWHSARRSSRTTAATPSSLKHRHTRMSECPAGRERQSPRHPRQPVRDPHLLCSPAVHSFTRSRAIGNG